MKMDLKPIEEKMQKCVSATEREFGVVRAGRANATILDRITVDYYGTPTALNQVGNISSPEPRLLVIAPWEPKMIGPIEKAIQKSDLGINPSNDGKVIRLLVPELTGENGERYTDHNPMLTEFTYTVTGSLPAPETLAEPVPVNEALLNFKEVLWTFLRLLQAFLGIFELPYLAYQGVEMLANGKMP